MGLQDWLAAAESTETWQPLPGAGNPGGVMEGTYVTNGVEVAWLKPRADGWDVEPRFCPALERTASRLAHAVGVRVPPVQLYRSHNASGDEYPSCLSYVASPSNPSSPKWLAVMNGLLGDEARAAGEQAIPGYLPIVAFDLWVAAADRWEENAVLARYDDINVVAHWQSIDYSRSQIWHDWWRDQRNHLRWQGLTCLDPLLERLRTNGGYTLLQETVEIIQGLTEETIRRIVDQVPDWYIAATDREVLIEGLLQRRQNLEQIVHAWL